MKKFKTKQYVSKLKILILILLLLLLFIIVSFYKLSNSYEKLTQTLLKRFSNNNYSDLRFLTSDLDLLLNSYTFRNQDIIKTKSKPLIYLYNTHDDEKYADNLTIYEATKLLKNNLTKLGIKAIQEEEKTSKLASNKESLYDISRTFIKKVMKNNDISYCIDIHRDNATDTLIKINGKNYAKIMFVLGLENPDYLKNKEVLIKMNNYLNTNYPGISKGIYEKKGDVVDGVYNQDIKDNVVLIEIGGIKNNTEEVNNSTEIISLMLYHMLGE